jgi:hypothetical protein
MDYTLVIIILNTLLHPCVISSLFFSVFLLQRCDNGKLRLLPATVREKKKEITKNRSRATEKKEKKNLEQQMFVRLVIFVYES